MSKKKISSNDPFAKMNEVMNNIAPDGDMIEDSPYAHIDEWLNTGSYILNAALSGSLFGGVPNRRSVVWAGEQGCLQKDEEVEIYQFKSPKIIQKHGVHKYY
ncbi:MAG: hypothetical protein ACOC1O_01515 [bacterium]